MVGRQRLGGEAGDRVLRMSSLANVVLSFDGAGEEALAERAEGDEADAELVEGREDFVLSGARPPQRVLALHRGDGVDGVGPADGAGGGFGQAEVAHLARVDSSLTVPATSSMGTSGSTRCW